MVQVAQHRVGRRRAVERRCQVPLSEHEQRILHEMEQNLRDQDPKFVGRVASRGQLHQILKAMRWPGIVFVVGFAVMIVSFRSSLILASCGFAVMLFSALYFERKLRQMDNAAITMFPRPFAHRGLGEELSGLQRRLRDHFKHPSE
jgi:hypothetical protein